MAKGGSEISGGVEVMPEDAPVNIGALLERPFAARQRVLGMQTKLHRWAVADPGRRFDDLYNLVADPGFLAMAWDRVRHNTGARSAGVDRRTVRAIEESTAGVVGFLEGIRRQLKTRTFAPLPVRQRKIPKSNGKLRSLGIPTVTDRVVQAAVKLVLEPILEVDFSPSSYGFRPERRAQDAVEEIRLFAHKGYEWVFEGDIAACFDEIDHAALLERLRRRVTDKRVLALVKAFLKSGLLDEEGIDRDTHTGTPQGGILSPLLANLALTHLDDYFQARWAAHRNAYRRQSYRARGGATYRLVRYADDFVIMIFGRREHAEAQWAEVGEVLSEIGLRLAPEKTHVTHIDQGFDFLGFRIQRHRQKGSNRRYVYSYPSTRSVTSIRRKIKAITGKITQQTADQLYLQLSRMIRGWSQYFRHGASSRAYHHIQNYVWWRVWRWLLKKHPRTSKRWIVNRYYNGTWPEYDGVTLYKPASMTIQRYRYRGAQIPTPWIKLATAAT